MNQQKSQRYPMPMHPPELYPLFLGMCTEAGAADLKILAEKVAERRGDKLGSEGRQQELALIDASFVLLSLYPQADTAKKKLIVGAVRLFLMHRDAVFDDKADGGLSDDIAIMNHVLEQLGDEGHFIG